MGFRLFAIVTGALVGLFAGVAIAQETTSLDPLGDVVRTFADAEETPVVQAGEGPILRQFQMVVNLGEKPTFPTADVELVPRGFSSTGDLASLEEFFRGTLGPRSLLPPLDPMSEIGGTLDPARIGLDGWSAFGEFGAVEDGIDVTEGPTVVWGVELAEPFDPTCAAPRVVGRVWSDVFLGDPETPFGSGDLVDRFGPGHAPLAGAGSRIMQLSCEGTPTVGLYRMKDSGIRPLSPNKTTALVKGNLVVFFTPMRQVGDMSGATFADGADDPAVVVSPWSDEIPLLLPNPYERFPVRIDLVGGQRVGAARPGAATLLFRPGDASFVGVSKDCSPAERVIYSGPLDEDAELWFQTLSRYGRSFANPGGGIGVEFPNDFGGTDTVTIDGETFTVTSTVGPGGPAQEACQGEGTVEISGAPAPVDDGDDGEAGGSPPPLRDESAIEDIPEPVESGGGIPWGPIALAGAAVVAVAEGGRRLRSRTRNCRPEMLAFDQAYDAPQIALEAQRRAAATLSEIGRERSELRAAIRAADVPRPPKPYPLTEEAEAEYRADLEAYDTRQAAADEARRRLPDVEARLADATRAFEEADAAHDRAVEAVLRAYEALVECRRRLKMAAPPPPALGEPDERGPEGGAPPEEGDRGGCEPGDEEWRRETAETFTAPAGVRIGMSRDGALWSGLQTGYGGTIPPDVFAGLSESRIAELSAPLDATESVLATRSVVSAEIDIVDVTLACERLYRCEGGEMRPTDQVRQRQTNAVRTESRRPSAPKADVEAMVRFVQSLQSEISALEESAKGIDTFECD